MPETSSSSAILIRRRLRTIGRATSVGIAVGWLATVLAANVMLLSDLVAHARAGTLDGIGGGYGLFALFVAATAWGAVGGLILGAPLGAILGAMAGAIIPPGRSSESTAALSVAAADQRGGVSDG